MENRPKTIFLDIDGCILEHKGDPCDRTLNIPEILPGVREKFNEWDMKGYRIIIVTGRRENTRKETENQLNHYGLFWDQLIMGCGGGQRILINDFKPGSAEQTAIAITLPRNSGLDSVNI